MKNPKKLNHFFHEKNKRGISEIIITLITIGLVLVATAIVWGAVNGVIKGKIDSSKSCFGNFGKVAIEKKYTCYQPSQPPSVPQKNVHIALSVGDVDIDGVTISVSNQEETESFKLTNVEQTIEGVAYFNNTIPVRLPEKNSGKTYKFLWNPAFAPKSIQIAPIINGNQCDVSDSLSTIESCATLSP